MKPRKASDSLPPSPEQLAAYADGELDTAARARVAAWLAEHGDAAAEVEALRRLDRLWQQTPPPEPDDAEWAATLARIVAQRQRGSAAPRRRIAGLLAALGLTAAAAVAAAMLLHPSAAPVQNPQPAPRSLVKVSPAVADGDVEIVSIDAADLGCLVVGEPPLRGPMVLVAAGDIVLDRMEPDPVDGMIPPRSSMNMNNPDGPMIVAPLTVASNR
jgi:hypothetical protein